MKTEITTDKGKYIVDLTDVPIKKTTSVNMIYYPSVPLTDLTFILDCLHEVAKITSAVKLEVYDIYVMIDDYKMEVPIPAYIYVTLMYGIKHDNCLENNFNPTLVAQLKSVTFNPNFIQLYRVKKKKIRNLFNSFKEGKITIKDHVIHYTLGNETFKIKYETHLFNDNILPVVEPDFEMQIKYDLIEVSGDDVQFLKTNLQKIQEEIIYRGTRMGIFMVPGDNKVRFKQIDNLN